MQRRTRHEFDSTKQPITRNNTCVLSTLNRLIHYESATQDCARNPMHKMERSGLLQKRRQGRRFGSLAREIMVCVRTFLKVCMHEYHIKRARALSLSLSLSLCRTPLPSSLYLSLPDGGGGGFGGRARISCSRNNGTSSYFWSSSSTTTTVTLDISSSSASKGTSPPLLVHSSSSAQPSVVSCLR